MELDRTLWAERPRNPSIRTGVRQQWSQFQAFPVVSRRETWRVPVPRIRDWLHRIEHCALRTAAQGYRPEGLSTALSRRSPPQRDTFAEAPALPASAPRTPWPTCALRTGRFLTNRSRLSRQSVQVGVTSSLSCFPRSARCRVLERERRREFTNSNGIERSSSRRRH